MLSGLKKLRREKPLARNKWFEVRQSPVHGFGAFAIRNIPEGTRLIEYIGEKITHDEACERYDDDSMIEHHTFLFTVDDEFCLDGGRDGNEARFFNHCCDPNCESLIEDSRIFVHAIREIRKNEELNFDYLLVRDDDLPENWRELYACRCGSAKCRGFMLDATQDNVVFAIREENAELVSGAEPS